MTTKPSRMVALSTLGSTRAPAYALREAMLRYSREVAFSTARVYARAAEARGAWDARLEALIVDALLHGDREEGLQTWGASLGWSRTPVIAIAGLLGDQDAEEVLADLRSRARRSGHDVLAGVQGERALVLLRGASRGSAQGDGQDGQGERTHGQHLLPDLSAPAWPSLRASCNMARL